MKKSMQLLSSHEEEGPLANRGMSTSSESANSIKNMEGMSNNRNARVNELLNKITADSSAAENNKLGQFTPITPPKIQVKRDFDDVAMPRQYEPPAPSYLAASTASKEIVNNDAPAYTANAGKNKEYGNYIRSYEPPANANKPYYAAMGIGATNDKMMERINYMIHLLEAQQHEKTNNITEEFILYTFLGVFMIFVVDSFARVGKYTR
jgi:hypothetical protein